MSTIDHGIWTRYRPVPWPEGMPENVIFCRNELGDDWYDYSRGAGFATTSIKMAIYADIVQAVDRDATRIFPPDFRVVEITDDPVLDAEAKYRGKLYDPETKTFSDPPPPPPPAPLPEVVALTEALQKALARIEALEARDG